jgi:TATA-box binding protein (TBP) (component of TFIID and TFIIIB)
MTSLTVDDFVARIEGTCGEEKDLIVVFKYEKKEDAINRIKNKATLLNSLSGIIFNFTFQGVTFRVYASGKAIFRGIKNREQLNKLLSDLLL